MAKLVLFFDDLSVWMVKSKDILEPERKIDRTKWYFLTYCLYLETRNYCGLFELIPIKTLNYSLKICKYVNLAYQTHIISCDLVHAVGNREEIVKKVMKKKVYLPLFLLFLK